MGFRKCLLFSFVVLVIFYKTCYSLPNWVRRCPRYDPTVRQCTVKLIDSLRLRMKRGIPELGFPALEPYIVRRAILSHRKVKGELTSIQLRGSSEFVLEDVKLNFDDAMYSVSMSWKELDALGHYAVSCTVFQMPWNARGDFRARLYNVRSEVGLIGREVKMNGQSILRFHDCDIDVNIEDFEVQLERGYDMIVSWTAQFMFNHRKRMMVDMAMPFIKKEGCRLIISEWNKVMESVLWSELFPKGEKLSSRTDVVVVT